MDAIVKVHDEYQIELKMNYPLPHGKTKSFYEVDLYFFAPFSLGINPGTYSKQQFYTDLKTHIRVKTPAMPLSGIAENGKGPLEKLRSLIKAAGRQSSNRFTSEYESQIKLFCCILKSSIRDFVSFIHETDMAEDRERLIDHYVRDVLQIALEYRNIRDLIQMPGFKRQMIDVYLFGDEYISLLIEDYTYHLLDGLSRGNTNLPREKQKELLRMVDAEIEYRKRRGYLLIPDETKDNEILLFRRSVLKKYMATVLFLSIEVKKGGFVLEQTLLGLAAGFAMLFATTIAFISQSAYGNLSLPFFLALVVSYIFKDRIKDLLRFYLSRKLTRFIFDHKANIYNATRNVVGTCKESFEFVRGESLSKKICEIRNNDHITDIENGWLGEQTFLYRKRIHLRPNWMGSIFSEYAIDGVNDIIRFNIQDFLRKMDDPTKEIFVMNDEGYRRIKGSRVYHLNLVVKLTGAQNLSYTRYRIVLNRQGIKRIEKVLTLR